MTGGFPAIQDAERKTTGWVIRWFFFWAIINNGCLYFCYLSLPWINSILDTCFVLGVPVLLLIVHSIMSNIYIIWNTLLTILGIRICVKKRIVVRLDIHTKEPVYGRRVYFIGKRGSMNTHLSFKFTSTDSDATAGQDLLRDIIFGGSFVTFLMSLIIYQSIREFGGITDLSYLSSWMYLLIYPATVSFSAFLLWRMTKTDFFLKADAKFDASFFTVVIITATLFSFVAIQSVMKFFALQTINNLEGSGMIVILLSIFLFSIIVMRWRNKLVYSVIDMWIDVLEGNMMTQSGETRNRGGFRDRFRRLIAAIKNRNNISLIGTKSPPQFSNDNQDSIVHEITTPSTIIQNVAPSALKSNLCSTCGGRKSLGDIYCPNCGH